jgi:aspartyl-tRNA(Asn)/glutamyl-tRNA(Gln) amidotransferase subunit A
MNGLPSLSVPCGTTAAGLPVGLQIVGRRFDEATLYRFGYAFEKTYGSAY